MKFAGLTKSFIFRFIRAAIAVIVAGIVVEYGDSAIYLTIAPLLLALDKWVRATK